MTTVEHRPWASPPERRYHRCDGCRERIDDRSLDAVLYDYLDEDEQ